MKKAILILLALCLVVFAIGYGVGSGYLNHESEEGELTTPEEFLPYLSLFQQYAPQLGWDWEVLAAIAYHESRFNCRAHSAAGACGLMQLMPKTAQRFGLNDSTIWEAEDNLRASVEYFQFLQQKWAFIENKKEQTKFILASYNIGPAVIFMARKGAQGAGKNSYLWSQVEPFVAQPRTRSYVKHVLKTANKYHDDYIEWQANSR